MTTFKDFTQNYETFSYTLLRFRSQNEVVYGAGMSLRLTKADLIACISYILKNLSLIGYIDRIKHGFVLDKFKYHELSVYLHGLLRVYESVTDVPMVSPLGNLYIKRFSHLPHDVLMPELKNMDVQVAKLEDMFGGFYYCCVVSGISVISDSFDTLLAKIYSRFPNIRKSYNIRLYRLT